MFGFCFYFAAIDSLDYDTYFPCYVDYHLEQKYLHSFRSAQNCLCCVVLYLICFFFFCLAFIFFILVHAMDTTPIVKTIQNNGKFDHKYVLSKLSLIYDLTDFPSL